MASMTALPPGSLVLVTGATSYIGTHTVHQLLKQGYRVRGTVRNTDKAAWLKSTFDSTSGPENLEVVIVPDMAAPHAFDDPAKGAAGLIHIASNLTFDPDPSKVIPETIAGVTNALEAAHAEPAMRRFVLCSSSYAAAQPRFDAGISVTHDTYNHDAVEVSRTPPPYGPSRGISNYAASKVLGEQAVRDFCAAKQPRFVANAVLPDFNLGPLFPGQPSLSSAELVTAVYAAGNKRLPMPIPPSHYVCVTDTARLLVIALTDAELQDRRLFAYGGKYTFNLLYQVMRKICPQREFPEDSPDSVEDKNVIVERDAADALLKKHYGEGFVDFETTLRLGIAGLDD